MPINLFSFLSLGLNLIILIVSACCFIKIMKNDLIHLQKDLEELKQSDKKIFSKVNGLCQRVARIEGKLEVKK